jgi:hypothetical protein
MSTSLTAELSLYDPGRCGIDDPGLTTLSSPHDVDRPWDMWRPGRRIPCDEAGVPLFVRILPQFAAAALKRGEGHRYSTWLMLRAADPAGSGFLTISDAVSLLVEWRGVTARHAHRILQGGEGRYWHVAGGAVFYRRTVRIAEHLGVDRVSRERLVEARSLGTTSRLRAALYTTCYATDAGGVPLTRRKVEELTGVPRSSQRRYENVYGQAIKVGEAHVFQSHLPDRGRHGGDVPEELRAFGFYRTKSGDLVRRHGDIRRSLHGLGGRGTARRLNREFRALCGPTSKACGQRPVRVYFPELDGPRRWLRDKRALGKQATRTAAHHRALAYGVVCRRGRRGQPVYEAVAEPREVDIV